MKNVGEYLKLILSIEQNPKTFKQFMEVYNGLTFLHRAIDDKIQSLNDYRLKQISFRRHLLTSLKSTSFHVPAEFSLTPSISRSLADRGMIPALKTGLDLLPQALNLSMSIMTFERWILQKRQSIRDLEAGIARQDDTIQLLIVDFAHAVLHPNKQPSNNEKDTTKMGIPPLNDNEPGVITKGRRVGVGNTGTVKEVLPKYEPVPLIRELLDAPVEHYPSALVRRPSALGRRLPPCAQSNCSILPSFRFRGLLTIPEDQQGSIIPLLLEELRYLNILNTVLTNKLIYQVQSEVDMFVEDHNKLIVDFVTCVLRVHGHRSWSSRKGDKIVATRTTKKKKRTKKKKKGGGGLTFKKGFLDSLK